MSETASPDDVRAAYRRLMRAVHPDVAATSSQSYPHSASAVNEAYRILVDPSRRFAYDRERRSTGSAAPSSQSSSSSAMPRDAFDWDSFVSPPRSTVADTRRAPWRAMIAVLAAATVGVVVLSALTKPSVPRPPDGVLQTGSCVTIEANGDAKETTCTGVDDIVMRVMVTFDAPCPQGTIGHRDRQGMGVACIEVDS